MYCSAVLHHIDLDKAYPEIARVFKPLGQVICSEPLVYNPLIQWYRERTPYLRTSWEIEHTLNKKGYLFREKIFQSIEYPRFFYLFTIAAVPFRNIPAFKFLRGILGFLEKFLLEIPFIQWYAWQIVFLLSEPTK